MRSVISRPESLRSTLTSWTRSSRLRLEQQLVVERRVERDGDAVLGRDRPAVAADPLDEHLVRLEHVAVDLEAAAAELLELPALQRLAHLAQLRAELRPEHGQVRLHAQLRRLDVAELDLLHAQLLGDLVGVALGAASRPRRRAAAAAGAASAATPSAPGGRARRRAAPRRSRRAALGRARATLGPRRRDARRRPVLARGSARGGRRGTASPARPPAATARARTRASGTRPRRTRRSGAASGGCTSSRGRRRTPRRRGSRRRSASPRSPRSPRATSCCVRSTSQRSSGRSSTVRLEVGPATARSPRCSRSRRGT